MATRYTFTATRGDTIDLEVVATRAGVPVDLTGALSIRFTAKRDIGDPDPDAVFAKAVGSGVAVVDAAAGVILVTITPAESAVFGNEVTLVWDVQVIEADGRVSTPALGTLAIERDVTRATT